METGAIGAFDGSHISSWDSNQQTPNFRTRPPAPFSAVRDSSSFSAQALALTQNTKALAPMQNTQVLASTQNIQELKLDSFEGAARGYGSNLYPLATTQTFGRLDLYV